jgi:hypothetical protein
VRGEGPFILSVAITDSVHEGRVYARCTEADRGLPEKEFAARILIAAFREAKRGLDACYSKADLERKKKG